MSPQGELRENVVTGRWVVVAPARGHRPVQWPEREEEPRPERSETCPFCPGNEEELPAVLWELPAEAPPGWRTRAVPNRYPAFSGAASEGTSPGRSPRAPQPERPGSPRARPLRYAARCPPWADGEVTPGRAAPAVGRQEVLIETPRHDVDLADLPPEHAAAVLRTYQARYRVHAGAAPPLHVALFRNQGRNAGTSLPHAHAQLVATAFLPPGPARREGRMRAYHEREGRCLLCALPGLEPGGGERTVFRGAHVAAFVPWAAEAPLEVWIVPRRHAPSFGEMRDGEREEMGRVLVSVARAYRDRGGDPDFNLLLHSWATEARDPALHWFVQLRPRVGRAAGFELLTTVTINASEPEGDAALLRDALERAPPDAKEART